MRMQQPQVKTRLQQPQLYGLKTSRTEKPLCDLIMKLRVPELFQRTFLGLAELNV